MAGIRAARPDDAVAIAHCLRRSIVELCLPDHGGDPEKYGPWIANKTPDSVYKWIENGMLLVAETGEGSIAGVALGTTEGVVELNYVHPDHRFHGHSKALMQALQDWFRTLGLYTSRLTSTATAKTFYETLGYQDDDEGFERGGMHFWRMWKHLT